MRLSGNRVLVSCAMAALVMGSAFCEGGKVKLNYLLLGENDTKPEVSVIKAFNESRSDVEVVPIHVEFAELDKQILLSAAGGSDYDIMQTNHSSVPQFVTAGVLEPLDDFIKTSGIDLSTYQKAAVKIGNIDGKQYAIPYNPDCRGLRLQQENARRHQDGPAQDHGRPPQDRRRAQEEGDLRLRRPVHQELVPHLRFRLLHAGQRRPHL